MAENQRVKLTKLLLKNSLLELMKEKSVYKISITEICDHAGINRSTFYKHYETEFDLLKDIENEHLSIIDNYLTNIKSEFTLKEILEYVIENIDVFKLFLDDVPGNEFFPRLISMCFEKMMYETPIKQYQNKIQNEYLYNFIVYGALAIVKLWISDENRISPTKMNDIMMDILENFLIK